MNIHVKMKIDRLQKGEVIISKEPGNSMEPILKSREPVILVPLKDLSELKKDDIVFCKVRGTVVTHKVYATSEQDGVLIGNNHGHQNGWTKIVYAKAHLIPRDRQNDLEGYLKEFKEKNGL